MKKWIALLLSGIMVFALAGCGAPEEEQPEEQIEYEIALLTESGIIMDGGASEAAWTAISTFGAEKGISHKYYKAAEATVEAYQATIDNAVSKGAKIIIAEGASFAEVIDHSQSQYPDVTFILMDAEPMESEASEPEITDNTMAIRFSSEQAGYLAGYGAVKEGFTQLGFIGDDETPVIMDYGYGFLQGAEAAAAELGSQVNVKYHYAGSENAREDVLTCATQWYEGGTEVIFACGSHVEMPVVEAAELHDKKVIASETDKSQMSDTIVTSAAKDISGALEEVLKLYSKGKFPGGESISYNAENDGIWLEMEKGRFDVFTEEDYERIYGELAAGTISVMDHTAGELSNLGLTKVIAAEE